MDEPQVFEEPGKWYLELVLLRAFQFNGHCARRLKFPGYIGDVEAVPWAKISDTS